MLPRDPRTALRFAIRQVRAGAGAPAAPAPAAANLDRFMPWLMLVTSVALWGGTWVALKIAEAGGMPPLEFATMRALPAGCALLAVAVAVRAPLAGIREYWRTLLGMTVSTAFFFGLGAYGAQRLPGGLSSLLGNTAPLFIVIVAATVFRERIAARAAAGVAIGFLGVAIIALPSLSGAGGDLAGIGELLLGSFALAFNTIWSKRAAHLNPIVANAAQMLGAGLALLIVAVAAGQFPAIPARADQIVPIVYVSVCATAFASVIWLLALRSVSAAAGGSMMLLVPVFGHLWSRIFLHERIDPIELLGAAVALAGIGLTLLPGRPSRVPAAAAGELTPR
ncbi:MAG: DMT family transporter [Vulcanimicrobiaceae bacterium]